jgi:hypothetical protein
MYQKQYLLFLRNEFKKKKSFLELFRSTESVAGQQLGMVPPHSIGVEILAGEKKFFGESNDV